MFLFNDHIVYTESLLLMTKLHYQRVHLDNVITSDGPFNLTKTHLVEALFVWQKLYFFKTLIVSGVKNLRMLRFFSCKRNKGRKIMWRHGLVPKGQRHHLRSSPADVVQYSALKLIDCSFVSKQLTSEKMLRFG